MVGGEQEHLPFRQAQQEGSLHVYSTHSHEQQPEPAHWAI